MGTILTLGQRRNEKVRTQVEQMIRVQIKELMALMGVNIRIHWQLMDLTYKSSMWASTHMNTFLETILQER